MANSIQKKEKRLVKDRLISIALLLLSNTWRINKVNLECFDIPYHQKESVLLYFWHGKYVPVLPLLKGYRGCVITSQSKRGNSINTISQQFGFSTHQIPNTPTRQSIQEMVNTANQFHTLGTAADGPLGPPRKVKAGIVWLASQTNSAAIPLSIASNKKWVLSKRWDSMEIPKPFANVTIYFGSAIAVPSHLRTKDITHWTTKLTTKLLEVDALAETASTANHCENSQRVGSHYEQ